MQSSQQPISSKQDSGDYQSIFNANHWQISPLPEVEKKSIQTKIDGKLKPLGSLGALEALAFQLACIQQTPKLTLDYPALLVFAADHGIANQAISIGPPSVTGQMVTHFLQGDAAINCFCRANNLPLSVIDAGMLPTRLPPHTSTADLNDPPSRLDPQFISQPVAQGSRDLSIESAMSAEQAARSLQLGAKVARQQIQQGSHVLAFGEMGIGNTAVAAAVLACPTSWPVNDCVGRGTGITDEQLVRKKAAIATGVERCRQSLQTSTHPPMTILTEVGGFDIGQICGALLATAQAGKTIVIDGFIVTVAALLACHIDPAARDYMIFAHCSAEFAHQRLLSHMQATPLLHLGLRLGEGTGAALALPLLQAAVSFYNDMASFDTLTS